MQFLKINIHWVLTLTFLLLILFGTLTPRNVIEVPGFGSDKLYHFLAFTLLVMPLTFNKLKNIYWVLPIVIIFGALIELIQPFVGRHGDINDFYADAIGSVIGVFMIVLIKLKRIV
jgi:VanZ family protein